MNHQQSGDVTYIAILKVFLTLFISTIFLTAISNCIAGYDLHRLLIASNMQIYLQTLTGVWSGLAH